MKKALWMTIAAAAALAAAACSKDGQGPENQTAEIRLRSGVEVLQARAATQENAINSGETVSVWVNETQTAGGAPLYKANQLTADGANGFTGGTAMYFPQTGNAVDIYALHGRFDPPFASGDPFPQTAVNYSVEAAQATTAACAASDLLYARAENIARNGNPTTAALTFYHMLAKLEIAIVPGKGAPAIAPADALTLGNNDITINGTFTPSTTADMTDRAARAAMLTPASAPQTATLALGQQISTSFAPEQAVYNEAIIVPQDMAGKVLTVRLASGGELKYYIPAGTTFESGKKYRYHITLNLTGLAVTSTIAPWETVGTVNGNAEME